MHSFSNLLCHFAQWPGRIFKVAAPMDWLVVVSDPALVNDIMKAPDHILSADMVSKEVLIFNAP